MAELAQQSAVAPTETLCKQMAELDDKCQTILDGLQNLKDLLPADNSIQARTQAGNPWSSWGANQPNNSAWASGPGTANPSNMSPMDWTVSAVAGMRGEEVVILLMAEIR